MQRSSQKPIIFSQPVRSDVLNSSEKITSFQQVIYWAKQLIERYHLLSEQSSCRHQAIYYVLSEVYRFTLQTRQQGNLNRIHSSCLQRLYGVPKRARSDFAIVTLVLTIVAPDCFDRTKRYRINRALETAQRNEIQPENLVNWLQGNGGYDRVGRQI